MRTIDELNDIFTRLRNGDYDGEHYDLADSLLSELLDIRCAQPRPQVQRFAEQMEKVLKENDHKGGWDNMHPLELLNRMKEETTKLADALENGFEDASIKETTDVANFAMMIFDVVKE